MIFEDVWANRRDASSSEWDDRAVSDNFALGISNSDCVKGNMDQFCFTGLIPDCRRRMLLREGEVVPIGSRAFDLLEMLVIHRDKVVPRDELMRVVWPDTVVGDNNLNVQVANLRRLLGPQAIVTVPGRGLCFALDVLPPGPDLVLSDRPSVVVLPFETMGGDPAFDWLADGFVEDITTELSRFRDLFVVARNSAFVYRQTPRDLRVVARELGVRYVVEGSVRARADRVRVTAQLIDAAKGGHVWAESFDRDMVDHFETQARVARTIVTRLSPQIDRAEADRINIVPPRDLTAHCSAQRAWLAISSGEMAYDPGLRDAAADMAQQALTRDARSALAWRVLAWVAWWNVYHGTTDSIPDTLAAGIDAATQAITIDKTDHQVRRLRAQLNFMKQDVTAALPELRQGWGSFGGVAPLVTWAVTCGGIFPPVGR